MEGSTPSNYPRPDTGTDLGKYDTHGGRRLCKKILAKYVTYDPHDYILDGICPVMDGFDLLATTPTGSGKAGYLILLIRNIATDRTLAIAKEIFPRDPVMIVVCPTMALEDDMSDSNCDQF
jgi:superfamily II DNA/RNA helicase